MVMARIDCAQQQIRWLKLAPTAGRTLSPATGKVLGTRQAARSEVSAGSELIAVKICVQIPCSVELSALGVYICVGVRVCV